MQLSSSQNPEPATADDDESNPFSNLLWAIGTLAVAVAVHVPSVWEQLADPEAQGRRSGWKQMFANIGPWPVTGVFGLLALVFLYLTFRRRD